MICSDGDGAAVQVLFEFMDEGDHLERLLARDIVVTLVLAEQLARVKDGSFRALQDLREHRPNSVVRSVAIQNEISITGWQGQDVRAC